MSLAIFVVVPRSAGRGASWSHRGKDYRNRYLKIYRGRTVLEQHDTIGQLFVMAETKRRGKWHTLKSELQCKSNPEALVRKQGLHNAASSQAPVNRTFRGEKKLSYIIQRDGRENTSLNWGFRKHLFCHKYVHKYCWTKYVAGRSSELAPTSDCKGLVVRNVP